MSIRSKWSLCFSGGERDDTGEFAKEFFFSSFSAPPREIIGLSSPQLNPPECDSVASARKALQAETPRHSVSRRPLISLQSLLLFSLIFVLPRLHAEDGYRLWLRFDQVENQELLQKYREQITHITVLGEGEILNTARMELEAGVEGLIGQEVEMREELAEGPGVVAGMVGQQGAFSQLIKEEERGKLGPEGFLLLTRGEQILLVAADERGLLYGAFHLLRMMQQQEPLDEVSVVENPRLKLRLLNHWDNLDRTVERGYAGFSIFDWHQLPEYRDPRYRDYARANASIGLNGTVVTNVNANALIFRPDYLQKVAALAEEFRPYGLKIYLTARFSAPIEQGGLETADPLQPEVQQWWQEKVAEIYALIPDFGGFLVKANSEGQPGPQNYGRTHADGANMLADALAPFGGVVMWRAFVYSEEEPEDRAKQAYNEFVPLDGQFRDNVLIQVKNGPIDFQPREPIHPLFGAMPETPLVMEFQVTKEYLGQGTHLVGLGQMWEEVLQTDTHVKGEGATVAKVIDGSLQGQSLTGMAGVSNVGTARNWTGNLFGQADWYSLGRLAWNPHLSAEEIGAEWVALTFGQNADVQAVANELLNRSHETCVRYMTPLGLHHIMAAGHHYGPGPWVSQMPRADWTSVYYHKADEDGIGFDRTASGSDAQGQYATDFAEQYADPATCDPKFLLWFHHLSWDHEMPTGRTLWEALCYEYQTGVDEVQAMYDAWESLEGKVDEQRYHSVLMHLEIQLQEARWWKNACLSYFQTFSQQPIPEGVEPPPHDTEYYQSLSFPYSPGIRPRW